MTNELALKILNYSRNALLVNMPFLSKALFSFKFLETEDVNFSSDGYYIYYNPEYVINEYKKDDKFISHSLLHLLLHFLFHHNVVSNRINHKLWNLACDIAIEDIINNLKIDVETIYKTNADLFINDLKTKMKYLNVESIYRYFSNLNIDDNEINKIRYDFFYDEHGAWYNTGKVKKEIKNWDELSKQIQTNLETFNLNNSSYLTQSLKEVNRNKVSLRYFLQKFYAEEEILKESKDNIDLILFKYSLDLYKDIAIVENEEFKEEKKINDLVIAIDTSGSVKGDIVKSFIDYTVSLLDTKDDFSAFTNLYIIECDDRIQEVIKINNKDDFNSFIKNLELKGFGETDFRPVFEYVNNLIDNKEIKNLKGLLYFTDGKGIFPRVPTSYKTAFIIHNERYNDIKVPSWTMKLELIDDDIKDGKFD